MADGDLQGRAQLSPDEILLLRAARIRELVESLVVGRLAAPMLAAPHGQDLIAGDPERPGESVAARVFLLVIGTFVLLVSVELSGLAGVAAELVALNTDDAADCCSDCPLEKSGKECPPGCPNCHCAHGGVALPPPAATAFVDAFDPATTVVADPTDRVAPRAPVLPGVYRPPRLAPTFV